MKRSTKQKLKRSLTGPVIGAALAIAGIATYRLASSEAVPTNNTEILAPAMVEATSTSFESDDRPAPDFSLKDVFGKEIKLSDYKGKVVVLNFWATWCPPCRREIPDFLELQKQYEAQGIQFIGIALDEEGLAKVKPYVEQNNITYPIMVGEKSVVQKYGEMNAIPVTILIDRKGLIRARYAGMRQKAVLESMVVPLLNEKESYTKEVYK